MGKRKKLELKTQRRQKIKLSPCRSDDELSDSPVVDIDDAGPRSDNGSSSIANSPLPTKPDDTLECFLKEIQELEDTNKTEKENCEVDQNKLSSTTSCSQPRSILAPDEIVWSENFDEYYECYYYFNHITQESTWYRPTEGKIIPFAELSGKTELNEAAEAKENPIHDTVELKVEPENVKGDPEIDEMESLTHTVEEQTKYEPEPVEVKPVLETDITDPSTQNIDIDEELDSFLDSPSENVNVIINGGNLGSLASICNLGSFGDSSDSEGEQDRSLPSKDHLNTENEHSSKNETASESKETAAQDKDKTTSNVEDTETSSVLIDIDEELESAVDRKHSETLMNNRMKVKAGMMATTLTSKFNIFELSIDDVSPLIKLFVEFNLLKDLYEAKSLSITDFVNRISSLSQQLTNFEKTIPANERCELRWCDSSKSYFYFDRLMDEKADIRPLLTNVKYNTLQSTGPTERFSTTRPENLPSENLTADVGTQVDVDDVKLPQESEFQNSGNGFEEIGEESKHEVCSSPIVTEDANSDIDGESIPESSNKIRNQILKELDIPSDWDIDNLSEDPGLQYKLFKKVKRYAKEQSRSGVGSKQEIMESVWEHLRLNSSSSPCETQSPRSVEELKTVSSENSVNNSPKVVDHFQSHLVTSPFDTDIVTNPEVATLIPPPPPPQIFEAQSSEPVDTGVVYCLPASSVQNYSDALPTVTSSASLAHTSVESCQNTPSKSTAIELITPQPKKRKAVETKGKQTAAAPANKFKNKNMGKLVDKWKKVKDEIREEPDAVEGEFYFEPRSADKWRDEQQKLQSNNPNLIEINETKNKLKMGKSKNHPFL